MPEVNVTSSGPKGCGRGHRSEGVSRDEHAGRSSRLRARADMLYRRYYQQTHPRMAEVLRELWGQVTSKIRARGLRG